jgi:hypothetical protein
MVTSGDKSEPGLGWQGGDIDVEIETIGTVDDRRYRWTLYDKKRVVRTGVRRTRWGTRLVSGCAHLIYRFYGWPAPKDPPPSAGN